MKRRRILLIGFGNMGQALVRGWLAHGVPASEIGVADPSAEARAAAAGAGVPHAASVEEALARGAPDVVVVAVKPAQAAAVLAPCRAVATSGALILSIAAGKTIHSLASAVGAEAAVVRAMPNTPAAIGRGITVLTASRRVSAEQRDSAAQLMAAVGRVEWVDDEALMDAVTAVSGSGPAYVFLLIECLARAGAAGGLDERLATTLATATVAGAGAYAESSAEPAAELRRRVTSHGGTTEAALRVLTADDAIGTLLERAVRAATERSRELSRS